MPSAQYPAPFDVEPVVRRRELTERVGVLNLPRAIESKHNFQSPPPCFRTRVAAPPGVKDETRDCFLH